MGKSFIIVIIALCSAIQAEAQSFLDHLQQDNGAKGKVTVTQSKVIDTLVNGTNKTHGKSVSTTPTTKSNQPVSKTTTLVGTKGTTGKPLQDTNKKQVVTAEEGVRASEEAKKHSEEKSREAVKPEKEEGEMSIPTVDMRKKVMRGSRRVTGYRVQAFAGGNTRKDKQQAQSIGNAIKMRYPEQPVYVHFYSPRWICRIGNFRSYQEAKQMLSKIKAMGYNSATIVKGTITVQY